MKRMLFIALIIFNVPSVANEEKMQLNHCSSIFIEDLSLFELNNKILFAYNAKIKDLKSQRFIAVLKGAGGRSSASSITNGMKHASVPYDNKISALARKRSQLIEKVDFERKTLKYENKKCFK